MQCISVRVHNDMDSMIDAKLNKLPHLSGRVFLLYLLQLSELLEVSILQLHYDWCLCQDSVTKSFFFTSLLFAVSPMAKILNTFSTSSRSWLTQETVWVWLFTSCWVYSPLGRRKTSNYKKPIWPWYHLWDVSCGILCKDSWASKCHVIMFSHLRQLPAWIKISSPPALPVSMSPDPSAKLVYLYMRFPYSTCCILLLHHDKFLIIPMCLCSYQMVLLPNDASMNPYQFANPIGSKAAKPSTPPALCPSKTSPRPLVAVECRQSQWCPEP